MKKFIKRLAGFVHVFGPVKGLALFTKTQLGYIEKIKLPGIQHPVLLRRNTSDFPTFLQVFIDREYKINFSKPTIVFDCGANIGLFGIHIKNEFPSTKLICVEPDPQNFEQLKKNLSLYSDVHFENCGIWNKSTTLRVYDKYNSGSWGMVVEEDLVNGTVPAVSIRALMDKYAVDQIDILKIDIEGSEKQLFFDNYEVWLPKVKNIVIEFHDWMIPNSSKPFFVAINQSFTNYELKAKGENIIIVNKDLG